MGDDADVAESQAFLNWDNNDQPPDAERQDDFEPALAELDRWAQPRFTTPNAYIAYREVVARLRAAYVEAINAAYAEQRDLDEQRFKDRLRAARWPKGCYSREELKELVREAASVHVSGLCLDAIVSEFGALLRQRSKDDE